MTKKSIDIQDEIEKRQAATPVILKCSLNFARKIKKERHRILLDPQIRGWLDQLTIKPIGTLPDHVVLLCDAHGKTIRMINLTARPKQKPLIIH